MFSYLEKHFDKVYLASLTDKEICKLYFDKKALNGGKFKGNWRKKLMYKLQDFYDMDYLASLSDKKIKLLWKIDKEIINKIKGVDNSA
jgi:hypothetical protein